MSAAKNNAVAKRPAKRNKKKAVGINGQSNKKINGTLRHNMQHATVDEFALLKDMSCYTYEELAALLGTTHRTIRNKKNHGESFDIAQTERLRKLNQLFKEGNEVFGNKEEFNNWLRKPAYGLDYDTPSELLKQPGGLDKVMNELNSINFGDTV